MKKNNLYVAALVLGCFTANAQGVGIGTPSPVASAMLEVNSTSKGFLMPRMTTSERVAVTSPAKGLQVFDTTTNTLWYFNGTIWVNAGAAVADNLGNHSATQDLLLNSNALQLEGAGGVNKIVYNTTVDGPVITGNAGGSLGTASGGNATALTWLANGAVGVGTTTPFATAKFQAAQDKTAYGEFGQLMATGLTDPNQKLVLGYNTTTDKGFIQSVHSGTAWTNLSLQPNNGNVTVGAFTDNATSKLEVNGASTNYVAYNAGAGRTINYLLSNLAYTTANAAGTFTLTGVKDGGTYSLAVRGTVSGTALFAASGFTVKYANNRPTTAGTETVYTLVVMGSTIYVYMSAGF
ncbi:hypothetical protein SAMN05421664_3221 [Chryseobacterium soldanellicola]|uniref:Uncharacterized protein n=1 Tax=Chryseobacterium soldanellicola TaxID=311333 RepID=A0A1H1FR84_9FLAO|nr:hypothetical protein [Chryseobacterium soldanellicola]SDR03573.1 hypothetical protein SAMN05421664_3221 [Chryseobacterium soldanellicola]